MGIDAVLTIAALVLSGASVIITGLFSVRTARLASELDAEREQRLEAQSALKAAERVYEPLAMAAAELQSRIFNIVETGWVPLVQRYKSHGDYAVTSTAYLFANYFGWIEARRQAVLSSSGEGGRDIAVQRLIDVVLQTLRRSEHSEGFLFFTTEQRAIGELMLSWETADAGARIPRVMGYASFAARFRDDEDFRGWFTPVDSGMALVAGGDHRRLIEIQRALVALIDELDPKRRYTVGYDLAPIEPDAGSAAPGAPGAS
ncbi:hypothetical protein [Agromyces aureus]|uniref:Uncharacterized protein n=1 Tax=Agromyces aureus TaxID=453304 RepID=A0A191WE75_9MICO|nr:hypothetical protein [Agromyces aureus]ANJ26498.1 hypothetical protein ATC03_06950 [Agromyces aureus]